MKAKTTFDTKRGQRHHDTPSLGTSQRGNWIRWSRAEHRQATKEGINGQSAFMAECASKPVYINIAAEKVGITFPPPSGPRRSESPRRGPGKIYNLEIILSLIPLQTSEQQANRIRPQGAASVTEGDIINSSGVLEHYNRLVKPRAAVVSA